MIKATFITFLLMAPSPLVFAYHSSHLKHFDIVQCHARSGLCLRATGEVGFVSATSTSLMASAVLLEFSSPTTPLTRHSCVTFRYEFNSQFLTCDNRELPKGHILTVDSTMNVKRI